MRAMPYEAAREDAQVEVFDLTELDAPRGEVQRVGNVAPPRLWVGQHEGQVVATVVATCPMAEVALVHCDFQPTAVALAQELLTAAFKYCKRLGVLKVVAEGRWEGILTRAAEGAGLITSRLRAHGGAETVELYVNLYRDGAAEVRERRLRCDQP